MSASDSNTANAAVQAVTGSARLRVCRSDTVVTNAYIVLSSLAGMGLLHQT